MKEFLDFKKHPVPLIKLSAHALFLIFMMANAYYFLFFDTGGYPHASRDGFFIAGLGILIWGLPVYRYFQIKGHVGSVSYYLLSAIGGVLLGTLVSFYTALFPIRIDDFVRGLEPLSAFMDAMIFTQIIFCVGALLCANWLHYFLRVTK
ncbi:MAG: hypothetical protein ACK4NR_01175 [Micavibrio sp.]